MTCGPGAHVAPRASPPGLSGRGAGKRRRACNYAPLPERPGELARRLVHMLNVERITKIFACDAEKCFVTNVKCPTGLASFWVKVPTVRSKTPVKCPGYAHRGGWAVLVLTVTLFRILESGFCNPFQKYQNG